MNFCFLAHTLFQDKINITSPMKNFITQTKDGSVM